MKPLKLGNNNDVPDVIGQSLVGGEEWRGSGGQSFGEG